MAQLRPVVHRGWGSTGLPYTWREIPDVAIDTADRVYLLTRYPGGVVVLDRDGTFLDTFGRGELGDRPHGITVAPDGTVYVVDDPQHVVRVFDRDGHQTAVIGTPGQPSDTGVNTEGPVPEWTATVARSAPPFNHPTKVAIGERGDLFVTDGYGNARVHHFDIGGQLLGSWGSPGTAPGSFMLPHSITTLRTDRLLVSDRENDRLQRFTQDGSLDAVLTEVQRPTASAEAPDGRIWVAELPWPAGGYSHRRGTVADAEPAGLRLIDADGATLGRWPVLAGSQPLIAPHGLATDSAGVLYIAQVAYSLTGKESTESLLRCELAPV